MNELTLHIIDIVENSVLANASKVSIIIRIDEKANLLSIKIEDNGKGIDRQLLSDIESPFYTTKKDRKIKVGLGIPLFKFSALQSGGDFRIDSEVGKGTSIEATFQLNNIDRPPLGNLLDTIISIIIGHQNIDFDILIDNNGKLFHLNTADIKNELEGVPLSYPDVYNYLVQFISEGLSEINLDPQKTY